MDEKSKNFKEIQRCSQCGASVGSSHHPGCSLEQCPFCKGQLLGCQCWMEKLGLPEDFDEELTQAQKEEWERILREKGQIPWGSEKWEE